MSAKDNHDLTTAVGEPAVILFGRDEKGKPHASTFDAAAAELAERAAGLMKFRVLRITTDEHRVTASRLPAGRIFSSGRAFVPFAKEACHRVLDGYSEAFYPTPPDDDQQPNVQATHVPTDWSDIKPGSLVLAATEPDQPWYVAVVAEARDDDLFLLQWRDWPGYEGFVRRRDHLSLLGQGAVAP